MNKIYTPLLIILICAVGLLFFKVYNNPQTHVASSNYKSNDTTNAHAALASIAYVELDSLNENITYIKNRRQELERKQKAIETEWKNSMNSLQIRANDFQKNAGSKTQQDAEKLQQELGQLQQQIEGKKQQQTQDLSQESYTFLEEVQKKLKTYISDYNKDKKYKYILTTGNGMDYMIYKDEASNITTEVIVGMNKLLNEKK